LSGKYADTDAWQFPHSGSYAGLLYGDGYGVTIQQTLAVSPGTKHSISAWFEAYAYGATANCALKLSVVEEAGAASITGSPTAKMVYSQVAGTITASTSSWTFLVNYACANSGSDFEQALVDDIIVIATS